MPFDIQKALHLEKALAKKSFNFSKQDYAVMEKLDGWYVYIDCLEGRWQELSSSACRVIPAFEHYSELFKRTTPTESSARLIFEATIPGKEFSEVNGIFNRKYEQAENVIFNLHDMVYFEETYKPFRIRRKDFINFLDFLPEQLIEVVKPIPVIEITNDLAHFREIFEAVSANGAEGIIGKAINAGYNFGKRNNDILKLKNEVTIDATVLNYFFTRGDKGNEALNLALGLKDGTQFTVVVAKHSAIDTILNLGQNIIGKIVEVQAMERFPTGQLRQPVFKDFRFNKTESD